LCNSTGYSVEVLVTDQCPFPNACTRLYWLDISPGAFSLLTNGHKEYGVTQLTWRFVECTALSTSKVNYIFATYSLNYGFELQVRNFQIGLAQVHIQSKSSGDQPWIQLNRTMSNTWLHGSGVVIQCPCRLRLTSIAGEIIIDENAFTNDIGSLPKRPNAINGNVQFTDIPAAYKVEQGKCIPEIDNPATPSSTDSTVSESDITTSNAMINRLSILLCICLLVVTIVMIEYI
jgi:expansin (peptidoglycan-binding protein)